MSLLLDYPIVKSIFDNSPIETILNLYHTCPEFSYLKIDFI